MRSSIDEVESILGEINEESLSDVMMDFGDKSIV